MRKTQETLAGSLSLIGVLHNHGVETVLDPILPSIAHRFGLLARSSSSALLHRSREPPHSSSLHSAPSLAHISLSPSLASLPLGLDRSHSIMTTTRAVLLMAVIVAAIASVSLASFPSELLGSYVYHDTMMMTMMMFLTATSIYLMTIVTGMLEKILARRARVS